VEKYYLDIEAYLDGSMPVEGRGEFEKSLSEDAALREAMAQFQELKSSLDWHFAAKDVENAAQWRALQKRKQRISLWVFFGLLAFSITAFFFWPKPSQAPAAVPTNEKNLEIEIPKEQQAQRQPKQSRPMAGNLKQPKVPSNNVYRDLPQENVSGQYLPIFEQTMKGFVPIVPESGQWKEIVQDIRSNHPAQANRRLLKIIVKESQQDTVTYLRAVTDMMLQRPFAAETALYPLLDNEKWKTEAGYLLVWVYLLRGDQDLARAASHALPVDYRNINRIQEAIK